MLVIKSAKYFTSESEIDVTDVIKSMIFDNHLNVIASNDIAGDPHVNVRKNLSVDYEIDGKAYSSTVFEGERLLIKSADTAKILTIVIPCREDEGQESTLKSLGKQTIQNFSIIVSYDEGKGANFARNKGFKLCDTQYVLFSDNDLTWEPDSIETMLDVLRSNPESAYVYGWYLRGKNICSKKPWNVSALKKQNFINTMAIIRAKDFPGFDEKIERLQDWDLWLTMLENGKTGIFLDKQVFSTNGNNGTGITFGNKLGYDEAKQIVMENHNL